MALSRRMPAIGDERKRLFAKVAERHPQLADIERETWRSIPGGPLSVVGCVAEDPEVSR